MNILLKYAKKYWILTLLIMGVIVGIFFQLITPANQPPPSDYKPHTISPNQPFPKIMLKHHGNYPTHPKTLPIYLQPTPASSPAQTISQKLNLYPHATAEGAWLSSDKNTGLIHNPTDSTLILSIKSEPLEHAGIDPAKAYQVARDYLDNLGYNHLQIDQNSAHYSTNPQEYYPSNTIEATSQNAHSVIFPLIIATQTLPTYFADLPPSRVVIVVSNNYQVQKVVLPPLEPPTNTTGYVTLISPTDALKNINQGNYIMSGSEQYEPNTTLNVDTNSVSLEYRLNPSTQEVAPYYRFKGIANNQPTEIIHVITPAF